MTPQQLLESLGIGTPIVAKIDDAGHVAVAWPGDRSQRVLISSDLLDVWVKTHNAIIDVRGELDRAQATE